VSLRTRRRIHVLFGPEDHVAVEALLEEQCSNDLPFLEALDARGLERFQFAALKLSGGEIEGLLDAIALAQTDWRDLLVAAGFADDTTAHLRWFPTDRGNSS
jgi:hypothetical protein